MMKIELRNRRGEVVGHTLVDDEDAYLAQWTWYPNGGGYVVRSVQSGVVLMHRQIMGFPPLHVDHRNGDPKDNRRSNLRLATRSQNMQNSIVTGKRTASGIRGVTRDPRSGKWRARCQVDGVSHFIGLFDSIEEAAAAAADFRRVNCLFSERDYATAV
jgi:hypothetical protein